MALVDVSFSWTVVLEKTLENPLHCKKIQPDNPKGNQSWIFIGRTDAEAETPVLWPPDAKSWLIWKDSDAGKDWRQEEKGMTEDEMVRWHQWLDGHEFEQALAVGEGWGGLACCSYGVAGSRTRLRDSPELNLSHSAVLTPHLSYQREHSFIVLHLVSLCDHVSPLVCIMALMFECKTVFTIQLFILIFFNICSYNFLCISTSSSSETLLMLHKMKYFEQKKAKLISLRSNTLYEARNKCQLLLLLHCCSEYLF